MEKDTPEETQTRIEKDGITFFIEDCDTWYFDNKHLVIEYNEQFTEPEFKEEV